MAFTVTQRLLLLALNGLPLLHCSAVAVLGLLSYAPWPWRLLAAVAGLYVLPPLLARLLLAAYKRPQGRIPVGSRPFFVWWALLQLQMLFGRLPQLEEALRLVPGTYSMWLRLWGARIGRLTFWAPGVIILDRSYLVVGDDVVFGAGVRVNPHVMTKNTAGTPELILATVKIGDRASVGGYALLTAGAEIAADEATHALLLLPPFSAWKQGKRVRPRGEFLESSSL